MISYKEPVKVICIDSKNSTKLIKGATYLASSLITYNYSNKKERKIYIKDVGSYHIDYFTLLNGKSLKNESDFNVEYNKLDNNKNYIGQFIRCKSSYSSSKILKQGEIYLVENQKTIQQKLYNGKSINELKLKIRGIKNFVTAYNFEEISVTEQRKFKLKNLKGEKINTGEQTRKFLLYSENERNIILLEILAKVLKDLNNAQNINVEKPKLLELILSKGKKFDITKEDVNVFLKNNIENIIKTTSKF